MLVKLADMELRYRGKSEAAPPSKLGEYLGGGDGELTGSGGTNTVTWNLFENQRPEFCDAYFVGTIDNGTGEEHEFEILGFFRPQAGSSLWALSAAMRIDGACDGLDLPAGGVVTGTFDMESYVHRYEVFRHEPGDAGR